MSYPFHLSFVVPNLGKAEDFYVSFLGCKKGRDTGDWIDIIFFGHQLTLHQETDDMPARALDHFGVILGKQEWSAILAKFQNAKAPFVLEPKLQGKADGSESGKFIVLDPAQNLIEFKFYEKSPLQMAT